MGVIGAVLVLLGLGFGFIHFLGWFGRPSRLLSIKELCPEWKNVPTGPRFPKIEWLGHSSYRVEWHGQVLLLDPVLGKRVTVAPRLCELPREEALHGVDTILVSHAHLAMAGMITAFNFLLVESISKKGDFTEEKCFGRPQAVHHLECQLRGNGPLLAGARMAGRSGPGRPFWEGELYSGYLPSSGTSGTPNAGGEPLMACKCG